MNSLFRLLAGVTALLGLALASAPSQAISVVGGLGWQSVPATCAVATDINFNLAQRKLNLPLRPASVQFTCTPSSCGELRALPNATITIACASSTVTALASTWSPFRGPRRELRHE